MSLVSIGQLVSCLILTGCAVLFSFNLTSFLKSVEAQNNITVHLKMDVSAIDSREIETKLNQISNISRVTFIPKDDALQNYSDLLGSLIDDLQGSENPLPNAFTINMKNLSLYDETVAKIQEIPGVDKVTDRSDIAKKLTNLNKLVSTASLWIFLVLSIDSLFIISNTIKITMYSRRLEISIMKSVGATDWFVRIPFIVEGVIIGLISAIIATLSVNSIYNIALNKIKDLLPFTQIQFSSVSLQVTLAFIGSGVLFGLIGGLISIRRYLKQEGGDIIG